MEALQLSSQTFFMTPNGGPLLCESSPEAPLQKGISARMAFPGWLG